MHYIFGLSQKITISVNKMTFFVHGGILKNPERIYNPITAMGFSAMFTYQQDNTKRYYCRHPIAIMGVVDTFGLSWVNSMY